MLPLGFLSSVGSLHAIYSTINSTVTLMWIPPFSLDLPGIDVTYCVDVAKHSSLIIHSECEITANKFYYSLPPNGSRGCDQFIFSVISVNVVGNGTSAAIRYSQILMGIILTF